MAVREKMGKRVEWREKKSEEREIERERKRD